MNKKTGIIESNCDLCIFNKLLNNAFQLPVIRVCSKSKCAN